MSVELINAIRYKCHCEAFLKDGLPCAHDWESDEIPDRCAKCKQRTWNRAPLRAGRDGTKVTAFGVSQTLAEWGRKYKIMPATIGARIRNGWTVEDAIAMPVRPKLSETIHDKQASHTDMRRVQ